MHNIQPDAALRIFPTYVPAAPPLIPTHRPHTLGLCGFLLVRALMVRRRVSLSLLRRVRLLMLLLWVTLLRLQLRLGWQVFGRRVRGKPACGV